MRRLVYLFILPFLFSANKSEAQSFSMQHDTIAVTTYAFLESNNAITNLSSSAVTVSWKIIYENFPQSWRTSAAFGLCDNIFCYDTSIFAGGTRVMDTISAGQQSIFKLQIDASSPNVVPTGTSPIYLTAELWDATTRDTVTFVIYKWNPNNVNKVTNSRDEVTLYPNPAYNEVNVTFNKEMGVKNVAVYNLVGKQISNYRVNGTSAKLDIDKIPSGIYFLRLIDANGRIVATRRFTHQ